MRKKRSKMERCLWPRMTSWYSPSVHAHHIVFCLVICIGKVVTRRACGWRTRQFPHLQPPFPLQILPRKSIKSFFLAFVVLVDISRSHPVHTSFLFIRFSMRFGRFSERFLLCERGARSSYSNHCRWAPRKAIWRRPAKIMAKLKRILQHYRGVAPTI